MSFLKLFLVGLFLLALSELYAQSITAEPTFASCSIYFPSATGTIDSCQLKYKKTSESSWQDAFHLNYDTLRQEFRGSIVRLDENSDYDVSITSFKNGISLSPVTVVNAFKTWNSSPPLSGVPIDIQTYVNTTGSAVISGVSGTPTAWKKITATAVLNGGSSSANLAAIQIKNCHYIILDGITVEGGYKHGIDIDAASDNIRIQNCDISKFGRTPHYQDATGVFCDVNKSKINHDAGINMSSPHNVVIERCYIHDPNGYTNPWNGIMQLPSTSGQTENWIGIKRYTQTHPQGPSAIYFTQARGGLVIRHNDLLGSQTHRYNDVVENSLNGDVDGGFNKDADIYGNLMAFGQDDGIELDGGQCNVRVFNNRVEQTYAGISTAPNKKGPSYIFNNLIYNLGDIYGKATVAIKNGGGPTHSLGIQYFFNNTCLSTSTGIGAVGYGSDAQAILYKGYSRNNIFAITNQPAGTDDFATGSIFSIVERWPVPGNSFDYDMLGSSIIPTGAGLFYPPSSPHETNGVFAFPSFSSLNNGVFTLKGSGNKAIDKGIAVPNFSAAYVGAKPDLGAFEFGASSLTPARPIDLQANKYFIMLAPGKTESVTISVGAIGSGHSYNLYKGGDMGWLTVTTDQPVGALSENSAVTLTFTATEVAQVQRGMVFFRLDNGFSVPVTVFFTGNVGLGIDKTKLSGLSITPGQLSPAFSSEIGDYTDTVANSVTTVKVTPTVSIPNAVITVNGSVVASGSLSNNVSLAPGAYTYITVRVTVDPDTTTYEEKSRKDYTIAIYRAAAGELIMPVNLESFSARTESAKVKLEWSTLSESDNSRFEILRSQDGVIYSPISSIPGSGTTATKNSYFFNDNSPFNGINYYHLSQINSNGGKTDLGIRTAVVNFSDSDKVTVYPNPTRREVVANFDPGMFNNVKVIDSQGRVCYNSEIGVSETSILISLGSYSPGNYFIKFTGPKKVVVKKIIKI